MVREKWSLPTYGIRKVVTFQVWYAANGHFPRITQTIIAKYGKKCESNFTNFSVKSRQESNFFSDKNVYIFSLIKNQNYVMG